MKIKLAVLDGDINYLERMRTAFAGRYSEKIEFHLFTVKSDALKALEEAEFDLLLVNKSLEVIAEEVPDNCRYAYLSDTRSTEEQHPTICKFQRMDQLYGQILQVLTESGDKTRGTKAVVREGRLLFFFSIGGMGTAGVAAACAMRMARDKKVAYLNLELLGGGDLYFSGPGREGLTDIIREMRNSENNLGQLLKNALRTDESGVSFLAQAQNPLDMRELGAGGMLKLISELQNTGDYDDIVVELDFALDRVMMPVYTLADTIVMVGDCSRNCEMKTERALSALNILDGNSVNPLTNRIYRICGSAEATRDWDLSWVKSLQTGGDSNGNHANASKKERDMVERLADTDLFDGLL